MISVRKCACFQPCWEGDVHAHRLEGGGKKAHLSQAWSVNCRQGFNLHVGASRMAASGDTAVIKISCGSKMSLGAGMAQSAVMAGEGSSVCQGFRSPPPLTLQSRCEKFRRLKGRAQGSLGNSTPNCTWARWDA